MDRTAYDNFILRLQELDNRVIEMRFEKEIKHNPELKFTIDAYCETLEKQMENAK